MKKPFIFGCVLTTLLLVSFLYYKKSHSSNNLNQSQQKVYENNIMGIKFTYPSVLIPEGGSTSDAYTVFFYGEEDRKLQKSGIFAEKPANMIAIHSFTTRTYQEEVDRALSNVLKNRKVSDIIFKSYQAKEIVGNLEQIGIILNSKHIVVNKNGLVYTLGVEWYSDTNIEGYYNQVINSLEFTN